MATMIRNKFLLTVSYAELIANHYFSIYGKIKKKKKGSPSPFPPLKKDLSLV